MIRFGLLLMAMLNGIVTGFSLYQANVVLAVISTISGFICGYVGLSKDL